MSNVSIIIQREFNERVRKKSFIITTILMPVLMIVLMIAPALIMEYSRGEQKTIAVIDDSGLVAPQLQSNEELRFEPTDLTTEEARRSLTDRFGVLYIGSDILENPSDVKLYANASSSLSIESNITGQIEDILEAEKLKAYHIDNLQQILDEVKTTVTLQTFRNDKSQEAESQAQSSTVATAAGYILGFVLYMFLLIYGSMVMQSVIEEKNNRVLEVVVSSVRPFDLMLGKILGVALVAVVQVLIWGVLIFAVGAIVLPQLMPAEMMAGVQAMQQGMPDAAAMGDMDPEMLQAVAAVTDTGYILKIFVCLLLFVFGGYLLYSAMFAAVGSAVDNVQDASQLQMPVTLPIILALLMMLAVIKDPNSSDHPLHLARRDDGPHPLRHSPLGDRPLARHPLRLVRGDGLVRRQDLPRGHLHVRQETHLQGVAQVGALQILIPRRKPGSDRKSGPGFCPGTIFSVIRITVS